MSDFEAINKLVAKLTALEDAIQEIPVDDNVVKDDDTVANDKNLVEAMYNNVMGAGLGIPVNAKINPQKLQSLIKGLHQLAKDQDHLTTSFNNPLKLNRIKKQIADLTKYTQSLQV